MIGWLRGLSIRERWFVGGGAYIVLVALLVLAVLEPIHARLGAERARLDRESAVLTRLEAYAREIRSLGERSATRPEPPAGQSLYSVLNSTAAALGLEKSIVRITARGEHEVSLVIDSAIFDDLATWLAELSGEYGIEVSQAAIRRHGGPGMVSGSMTMTAGR